MTGTLRTTHPRWHIELAAWLTILAIVVLGWIIWETVQSPDVSQLRYPACEEEDASAGPSPCEWTTNDGRTLIIVKS